MFDLDVHKRMNLATVITSLVPFLVVMISLHAAPVMMALLPAIKSGIYPVQGNGPHFCLLVLSAMSVNSA